MYLSLLLYIRVAWFVRSIEYCGSSTYGRRRVYIDVYLVVCVVDPRCPIFAMYHECNFVCVCQILRTWYHIA